MQANRRNISDVFNRLRILEIPFFQRSYVWDEENWERFLDDMCRIQEARHDYFLGSIILKQQPVDSGAKIGDVRSVIDGQQRITTMVVFFKALCAVTANDDLFKETYFNATKELGLRHNHNDVEVFEAIAYGRLTADLEEKYSENLVLLAYKYFEERSKVLATLEPLNLLSRIYFIGIDLTADDDEQQIFDTINSLGVSLSTAELLKNELFRRTDLALYKDTWEKVFESDEETKDYWETPITAGRFRREHIDLLLQSFLAIRPNGNEYAGVEKLFEGYKRYLKTGVDKVEFVRDLQSAAKLYRGSIQLELLNERIDPTNAVDRLVVFLLGLNTTTVFPYLLYILRELTDAGERARMLRLLESFLVRRLICRETGKNYNNLFASLVRKEVKTYDALVARLTASAEPSVRLPNDAALEKGFEQSNLSNQQARVVLYMLETSVRDNARYTTTLLGLNGYTLEHVMPKKWRNQWSKVEGAEAGQRDEALRKLGNMTLLTSSLNSAVRDATWQVKRKGKGTKLGLEQYGRGLVIFDEEFADEDWSCETISKRGNRLVALAKRTWPYPELGALKSNLSGSWRSEIQEDGEWSNLAVRLVQNGDVVAGDYVYEDEEETGGKLEGKLSGSHLVGSWHQDDLNGPVTFAFSPDGKSFEGRWETAKSKGGEWKGTRSDA
jgi:hypothetical protein